MNLPTGCHEKSVGGPENQSGSRRRGNRHPGYSRSHSAAMASASSRRIRSSFHIKSQSGTYGSGSGRTARHLVQKLDEMGPDPPQAEHGQVRWRFSRHAPQVYERTRQPVLKSSRSAIVPPSLGRWGGRTSTQVAQTVQVALSVADVRGSTGLEADASGIDSDKRPLLAERGEVAGRGAGFP